MRPSSLYHPLYPKLLKQISDPPLVLFAIDNIQQLTQPKIAIVGTRNCSNYAKEILTHLTPFLVGAKLNIVSGMALGVDTLAHQTTLKLNANTIAVLGTGVDICFPYQNRQLYHQIASNGLLLSEFPLKSSPKRFHFPKRNRIISGLSLGILVIEAAMKSGSLITVFQALEQNSEIFAIPGNIFHHNSLGCHQLIQLGAKLIQYPSDILQELTLHLTHHLQHLLGLTKTYSQNLNLMF